MGAFAGAATVPLHGPWFTGAGVGSNPTTGGTPSITTPDTNTFSWGTGPANSGQSAIRGVIWTHFPSQSLVNEGDAISVTFNFRVTDTLTNAGTGGNGFRFGLFDSAGSRLTVNLVNTNGDSAFLPWRGYSAMWAPFANPTAATTSIRVRTADNLNPLSTTGAPVIQSAGLGADILTGLECQASLTITRHSATEYRIETVVGTNVLSGTTNSVVATQFDSFVLLNTPEAGRNNSIDFADVTVQVIPGRQLAITSFDYDAASDELTLQWNSVPNMLYSVWRSTHVAAALATWTLETSQIQATPPTNTLTIPLSPQPQPPDSPKPQMFFVVEEYPAPGGR